MSGPVEEGDKVSWTWNGSHPSGTAAEVKAGEVTVVSHRGNEISKTGDEKNPAVHIERSGNDVVKTADELKIDSKGDKSNGRANSSGEEKNEKRKEEAGEESKEERKSEGPKQGGKKAHGEEAQTGDKRKADDKADTNGEKEVEAEKDDDAKKLKTGNGTAGPGYAANGEKKRPGRPKGAASGDKPKKEKKTPVVGKAQRKTRSQGAA